MIYLASPYSHEDEYVREQRFIQTRSAVIKLTSQGQMVFSPIVYYHQIALYGKMPSGYKFWQSLNHSYIDLAESVLVLQLAGWQESKGVQDEITYAGVARKSVSYITYLQLK